MAHKFVLLVREFHLEREWADVVKIVVGKFPLLEASIQPSALSTQPEGSNWQLANSNWQEQNQEQNLEPQRTRRNAEAGEMSEPERIPLKTIEQEPQPRAAVPHEHGMGMRLGKVVAAALAIEILMAAQRSRKQLAISEQQLAISK
jgi:hypothetical protein